MALAWVPDQAVEEPVLPQSLVVAFIYKAGWRETERIIHKFQAVVVDKLGGELKSGWQGR